MPDVPRWMLSGGGSSGEPRRMLAGRHGLYLIVTRPAVPHEELVSEAVRLRVPVVQLREKDMDDRDLIDLATRLTRLTRGTDTLLIVNDRPDLALRSGADGVHIGAEDASAERARELVGDDRVVGVSGNTAEEARRAMRSGADYLGIGPIFPTTTKPDARPPTGLGGLRSVVHAVPELPAVAVGGIDRTNAADVLAAGARYVAVVSAVCFAADPLGELRAFVSEIVRSAR